MSEIDEIKARLDIVDVIGGYVQLQKAGRSYKAVCPFHSERTPSFFVSPERQSWHCFGACGEGGDVFSFLMKREGVEFPEALRLLAERAGVALPERRRGEEDAERERLRQANEAAARYYHRLLLDGEDGRRARRYLEERGLDRGTLQDFQLGFAPAGWENLLRHLRERGYREEELLSAGLLTVGERGPRDLFHERIMFPITDLRGRVVGFGGRSFRGQGQEEEVQPKYLNTAQTALFDKGSLLYGLDKAKDDIRREGSAVIVEGYMDAIAAHQHGYANVVASMGTALTERQVRLLKRFSRDVVLALDADTAGQEATLRAVEYQELLGGDIRVAILPPGLDPDQAIRRQPESWLALLASAQPLLDYKFQTVAASLEGARPWERSRAVDELLPLLSTVGDRIVQAHYLQRLARLAQVREGELQQMLLRRSAKRRSAIAAPEAPAVTAARSGDAREEFCLALLLRHPELREDGLGLSPELFWHIENRQLLGAWQACEDIEDLAQALPEELEGHVRRLGSLDLPPFEPQEARAALRDCVGRLKQRELEAVKQASSAALAAHEADGRTTEQELAAAAAAWQAGSPTAEAPPEETSPVAALLRDTEIGLRLHQDSRMEPEEEDRRYLDAEKVENG